MLKLTEVYTEILQEGANEDQARKFIEKNVEDPEDITEFEFVDNIDELIDELKNIDPTEQNKYLPLLAKMLFAYPSLFHPKSVEEGFATVYQLEEKYGAKLLINKEGKLYFNKDVEEFHIEAGDDMDYKDFLDKMKTVGEQIEKLEKLKKAQKTTSIQDEGKPEVDGEAAEKVYENKGIRVYAGTGEKACIRHSKGTDWCIGRPSSGHYHSERAEGKSFYFVYDDNLSSDVPASRVVIEIDEDGTIRQVHDKRNQQDDMVDFNETDRDDDEREELMDGDVYVNEYLEDVKGIPEHIFEPIPESSEDEIMKTVKNSPLNKVLGEYMETEDGTVVDLTKEWLKLNDIRESQYELIKEHPIAKKFRKEYLYTAFVNFRLAIFERGEFKDELPEKKADNFFKKQLKQQYNGDLKSMMEDLPYNYLSLASDEFINNLYEYAYKNGGLDVLAKRVTDRLSEDQLKRYVLRVMEDPEFKPGLGFYEILKTKVSQEFQNKVVIDLIDNIIDNDQRRVRFLDNLLTHISGVKEAISYLYDKLLNTDIDLSSGVGESLFILALQNASEAPDEKVAEFVEHMIENYDPSDFFPMLGSYRGVLDSLSNTEFKITGDYVRRAIKDGVLVFSFKRFVEHDMVTQEAYDIIKDEMKKEQSRGRERGSGP